MRVEGGTLRCGVRSTGGWYSPAKHTFLHVKCEPKRSQRTRKSHAVRSLSVSPQMYTGSYRGRGTQREQPQALREQRAVRTARPKLRPKHGRTHKLQTAPRTPHRSALTRDTNRTLYRTPSVHRTDPKVVRT